MDLLIKGATIYDGSGGEPYISDVGVEKDKISFVCDSTGKKADIVIDATGLALSPGFIDTHAHSDFTILADPRAEGKISQGITTEINGNCGMSAAPLYGKVIERREQDLKDLDIKERWNTFTEYFDILESRRPALNIATLTGHGNIRGAVIGYDDRPASSKELEEMSGLIRGALAAGAIGLSTGLIYPPGVYSSTEELIRLAGELKGPDLIYTSHMRSEGDRLIESIREVLTICSEASIKVHISHIKTSGNANWHKAEEALSMISGAARSGCRITCDRYPYTASSTDLDAIFPSWVFDGGNEDEIKRLKDPSIRSRIQNEMVSANGHPAWDKILVSSVSSERNRWMEGLSIKDIARRLNQDELAFVCDLLIQEGLRVGAIFLSMSEENLRKFLSLPFCMIGSDSSARSFDGPTRKGKPHPRGFGTFPRFFSQYVRNEKVLSLNEAVFRSTGLAATTFGLGRRGLIKEGHYADLVIFDPVSIEDNATYAEPFSRPSGIHYVFVNGEAAIWQGTSTGRRGGHMLGRK